MPNELPWSLCEAAFGGASGEPELSGQCEGLEMLQKGNSLGLVQRASPLVSGYSWFNITF